jgi:hypothetical protein
MFIMATALKAKYTNLVILTVFSLLWRLKASKITSVLEESFLCSPPKWQSFTGGYIFLN